MSKIERIISANTYKKNTSKVKTDAVDNSDTNNNMKPENSGSYKNDYVKKAEMTNEELMEFAQSIASENEKAVKKIISEHVQKPVRSEQKKLDFQKSINDPAKAFKEQMDKALEDSKKRSYDKKKIAKKIARGQKCSKKELEFLEENDPLLYSKAVAANESRKMTEARIRSIKSEEQLKKAVAMAKASCAGSDADFSELLLEAAKDIEERYVQKKKKKDGFTEEPFYESKAIEILCNTQSK